MKILYGVQGTGNGHITRARHLVDTLAADSDIEVDYFFSGRDLKGYFDMGCFGNFIAKRGLTFNTNRGEISYTRTLLNNNLYDFAKDVRAIDIANYDLILNDFEPITAWASRLKGIPSISISHQAALLHPLPNKKPNILNNIITRYFAPTSYSLGTHWYHFGFNIIPPFVAPEFARADTALNKNVAAKRIIVYLPFEDINSISEQLEQLSEYQFVSFHPLVTNAYQKENIEWNPPSTAHFRSELISSNGVICNAGFELMTECLTLEKSLLVKPLHRQYEQIINATTLEKLGLCRIMSSVNADVIEEWLQCHKAERIAYSSDSQALVAWIKSGEWHNTKQLCAQLWDQVTFSNALKSQLNKYY